MTTSQPRESRDGGTDEVVDWTDLGQRMWSFLTGREAAIHYRFEEMAIEVPRDTGSEAPRATWKLERHAHGQHQRDPGPSARALA